MWPRAATSETTASTASRSDSPSPPVPSWSVGSREARSTRRSRWRPRSAAPSAGRRCGSTSSSSSLPAYWPGSRSGRSTPPTADPRPTESLPDQQRKGEDVMTTEERPTQTTDGGTPVESDEYSLTVGAGGPILLQDSYLIEQMANFNRERIAERQPHAKGNGAFGRFEVTQDVSAYTRAAVFQPDTTTPIMARFSAVAGERGSPDLWRDLRGFAVKFYTSEGNYDMVGNDTPVFFIKDPIHFQTFIRSQKRRADN